MPNRAPARRPAALATGVALVALLLGGRPPRVLAAPATWTVAVAGGRRTIALARA